MTMYFPSVLNAYPATAPYIAQIPAKILQGDSATWIDRPYTDVNGTLYDAGSYTLKYTLAGPIAAPLTLTATNAGSMNSSNSWATTLTASQSASLVAGLYSYAAQAFAPGVRVTLAVGDFTVLQDLVTAGGNYDPRTKAEIALADAETALATFQKSGGRLKEYTIGGRHMVNQDDASLLKIIAYWRSRVISEKTAAAGGMDRLILIRAGRAR